MLIEVVPLTDIVEVIDEIGEAENDAEADKSGAHSVEGNVDKVLEEFLLLEVVPGREDHWGQECIEKEFLVELVLGDIVDEEEDETEDEADDDADSGLVNEVDLL